MHALLPLSCVALLVVIAVQDFLYAPLRNETISAGLTGPYHVLLDASYVPLAIALVTSFRGWMEFFAVVASMALLLVAATNTAWAFFDSLTDKQHSLLHSTFTLVVFVSALALQVAGDHEWRWALTALNVLIPAIVYAYFHFKPTMIRGVAIAASPAAEKAYVSGLCIWLTIWSFHN